MEETINIKCPNDGALLMVKNRPGLENMSITCPVCKQKMPFFKMIRVQAPDRQEKGTDYEGNPANNGGSNSAAMGGNTTYPQQQMQQQMQQPIQQPMGGPAVPPPLPGMNQTVRGPRIRVMNTGQTFPLRQGMNIIGRQAQRSSANIQLPPAPMNRMSREHIKIDVRMMGASVQCVCSLFKPDCNATYVNGMPLIFGNSFVLQHGTVISLPDCEVIFEMN